MCFIKNGVFARYVPGMSLKAKNYHEMKIALLYLLTAVVFFVVDLLWLGVLAKSFYNRHLGNLMAPSVNWKAAGLFYVCFIGGLLYFVIWPALEADSLQKALISGAVFGFITYMTYEFTNWAMVRDWPGSIVGPDILWGIVLCFLVSGISFWLGKNWIY